jgi:hypothetical protein
MTSQNADSETLVTVRRQWDDTGRTGRVRLADLRHFHYRTSSGGYGKQTGFGKPYLHARMWCDKLADGEIGHSCRHGPPPHEVLVCITQTDNGKPLYTQLAALAADQPAAGSARKEPKQ